MTHSSNTALHLSWVTPPQKGKRAFGAHGLAGQFVAAVHQAQPDSPEARSRAVEECKAGIRNWMTSYRLVSEGEVTHAGLPGWQMEIEANNQGHDNYYVYWIFTTSELGYELMTSGPVSMKAETKEELERMCSNFELITR